MTRVYTITNGVKELFGEFISPMYADHHIALAKSTSHQDGYIDYSNAVFIKEEYANDV